MSIITKMTKRDVMKEQEWTLRNFPIYILYQCCYTFEFSFT